MAKNKSILAVSVLFLLVSLPALFAAGEPGVSVPWDRLIRVPLVRQSTGYTCGVASLLSVISYFFSADPELRWVREDKLAAELGTTSDGTNFNHIAQVARAKGLSAEVHTNMKLDELKRALDERKPVILAIQAWSDDPTGYKDDKDSGHYVVAIGYNAVNFYFMDPSTLGNYAFIPADELPDRWHDVYTEAGAEISVIGLGIVFSYATAPTYNPEIVRALQ